MEMRCGGGIGCYSGQCINTIKRTHINELTYLTWLQRRPLKAAAGLRCESQFEIALKEFRRDE